MYGIIHAILQHKKTTQKQLSEKFNVSQTQISRWANGKHSSSFKNFCNTLKVYAASNPLEWMSLLSSSNFRNELDELKDILFLTQSFPYPSSPLWVISSLPAECQNEEILNIIINNIKKHKGSEPYITYWIPESIKRDIILLILNMKKSKFLSDDDINRNVRIIFTPRCISFLSYAIFNPLSENRVSIISSSLDSSKDVWTQVIPSNTTNNLVHELKFIYTFLNLNNKEYKDDDGINWKLFNF